MRGRTGLLAVLLWISVIGYGNAQGTAPSVVEAVAVGHSFELSTTEVPAGWTTFRLDNQGDEVHFMVVERLPEGKTLEDTLGEVVPTFQDAMDLINEGDSQAGFARLGELPAWFADVEFTGGPGLVSPGRSGEVTANLRPGTYVLECYVKDENGEFHSYHGMIEQLIVSEEKSDAPEPLAFLTITVNNSGFHWSAPLASTPLVAAVQFEEHQADSAFGNDLHLVRLEEGSDLEEIGAWMDWSSPAGLRSPAPAEFVGGIHELPAGQTGYLTLDLEPGDYALIAEVSPQYRMWRKFTVQ